MGTTTHRFFLSCAQIIAQGRVETMKRLCAKENALVDCLHVGGKRLAQNLYKGLLMEVNGAVNIG